jgi:membrane-bound metal-dependent hydrolase YbcI (DUF457 family)
MTGTAHVVLALATVSVQQHFTGLDFSPLGGLMIVIGSLAPDLDGQGLIARPGRWVRHWVGKSCAEWLSAPFLLLSSCVRSTFGHRGFLHTPFWVVCMSLFGCAMGLEWLVFLSWGYATHIFGDLCTVAGVPLLGPLSWRRYRILRIRTGSVGELVVVLGVFVLSLLWSGGFGTKPWL